MFVIVMKTIKTKPISNVMPFMAFLVFKCLTLSAKVVLLAEFMVAPVFFLLSSIVT